MREMQPSSYYKESLGRCKGQYMKESNTLVDNAAIKLLQREVLLNKKGQCIKKSNTLTGNASMKQHTKEILLNTKGQYMKYMKE